ncbi:transposase family protein [Frankia sp. Cr1]|uniref:transposase family protein n=1 Tax=Frankia sp. Cr1 TaxID=3073931 RepID=UPI002AD5AB2F|nr:transposase family protein [Frankia sp. Cr1]
MSTEPIDCEQLDISSLLAMLGEIPDPRNTKGAIYSLRYILSTSLVSTMTGAKHLSEIGRWAMRIPQPLLARLGAPYGHFLGRYRVPSEKTIRRVLQAIDIAVPFLMVCRGVLPATADLPRQVGRGGRTAGP